METSEFDSSVKGACGWLMQKIALVTYFLCAGLPMALYVTCLLVVAIERRSTIELPIVMTGLLHPSVTLPIGIFAEFFGQYLSSLLFRHHNGNSKIKILRRIFTYSINIHFAVISAMIYYLYSIWITFNMASTLNFENKPFDQCPCDVLQENNIPCLNKETENSFQNVFLGVPIQPFLIAFFVTSVSCHLIHALVTILPPPIKLIHYMVGNNFQDNSASTKKSVKSKVISIVATVAIIIGTMTSPYYIFGTHLSYGNFKIVAVILLRLHN